MRSKMRQWSKIFCIDRFLSPLSHDGLAMLICKFHSESPHASIWETFQVAKESWLMDSNKPSASKRSRNKGKGNTQNKAASEASNPRSSSETANEKVPERQGRVNSPRRNSARDILSPQANTLAEVLAQTLGVNESLNLDQIQSDGNEGESSPSGKSLKSILVGQKKSGRVEGSQKNLESSEKAYSPRKSLNRTNDSKSRPTQPKYMPPQRRQALEAAKSQESRSGNLQSGSSTPLTPSTPNSRVPPPAFSNSESLALTNSPKNAVKQLVSSSSFGKTLQQPTQRKKKPSVVSMMSSSKQDPLKFDRTQSPEKTKHNTEKRVQNQPTQASSSTSPWLLQNATEQESKPAILDPKTLDQAYANISSNTSRKPVAPILISNKSGEGSKQLQIQSSGSSLLKQSSGSGQRRDTNESSVLGSKPSVEGSRTSSRGGISRDRDSFTTARSSVG